MTGNLALLRDVLGKVGYTPDLIEASTVNEAGAAVPWYAGYVRLPRTARNACVAAVETDSADVVKRVLSETGAAFALVPDGDEVAVWQGEATDVPRKFDALPMRAFTDLTEQVRTLLDPRSIHRAKTLGRFDETYQQTFVDAGLLPRIEQAQGEELRRLLERIVRELRRPSDTLTKEQGHQVLTIAFWVLAARMLRDHGVADFVTLKPEGAEVLDAVSRHYGGIVPILARNKKWQPRVDKAVALAWKVGDDFGKIGPEAIGYVYESSLIAKQTRKDLGTHSTPPFLVEYVLGRLRDKILDIPPHRRLVIEPASGHGAFLVAALRVLAEEVPATAARHDYLKARLRGLELDHAAKEMARLSLTIADVPNPDGWDLRDGDMFEGDALASLADGGTVLLANAPFEDFNAKEHSRLDEAERARGGGPVLWNKTAEMLRRALPALDPDALIGVIVPRHFLHRAEDETVRRMILDAFQLLEICVFPDRVFQFSSHECAVILAKGASGGTKRNAPVIYRRVRESGIDDFRACAKVSTDEVLPGSVFLDSTSASFAVPELRRLWTARRWPVLSDVATVQQGMSYFGTVRKSGHEPIRDRPFKGSALGVAGPGRSADTLITDSLPYVHMDIVKEHIRDVRAGMPTGKPQVVLNTHPHARGPWRLMAYIEPLGAAVPSTRIAVRPRGTNVNVEVLWAICNSLMANAFVYAHLGKRDIKTGTLEGLPVPVLSSDACAQLTGMVRAFLAEARKADRDEATLRDRLRCIDVTLLGAYGIFAPAEQQILSLFDGHVRPGLPFKVTSIGSKSRLPQYLEIPDVQPELPPPSTIGRFARMTDIDAEIDDGRQELAALRRLTGSGDPRIKARIAYVRTMTRALEEQAAEAWIPDYRVHE
jgi:type I restriction-modification system DNA methylase subunit